MLLGVDESHLAVFGCVMLLELTPAHHIEAALATAEHLVLHLVFLAVVVLRNTHVRQTL